jgi:tetratricopeptide (TPR) repeat protein
MADQRAERQSLQSELTALEVRLGITDQALRTFFLILEREVVPEQWPARLAEIALRHKQALERLAALQTEDPQARALIEQARSAIEAGDYSEAEGLLDQAEQLELAGIRAAEELLHDVQTAIERRRLSAAAVRAEQAEVFLIQLRYPQAAERFSAAAELVPDSSAEERLGYLDRRADALYRQVGEKGDNAAIGEAIRAYRDLVAQRPRERVPLDWAMTQNNLGNALQTLGQRESGTARLEEAVQAYRQALAERTRERVPLDWAMTQNNLGSALQTLGERESGTARLEEASACIANAWGVYKDAEIGQYDEYFRRRLEETKKLIDAR